MSFGDCHLELPKMSAFASPRPTPRFYAEQQTFSTKKARGTPKDSAPPRPPVKSAPPVSRIFPHRHVTRAQIVSFRSSNSNDSVLSPGYNEQSRDLYFNQCFEIISQLGVGSFGEVYKVRSREDGKYYAVKKSRDRFRGESDRRRKLEEVAKQETLPPHLNCVRMYKAWEERQHLYLLVELCHTSLSNYAETHHEIPEQTIWTFTVDLLQAVKHLHANNLVHMDIKPDNIFISHDGVCKLGDFGLVIDMSKGSDFSEAQEGDPKYLAPELMDGKYGKPADIFSLGMTILELASDLDLPRGGEGWHALRRGQLPEEFLRDKSFDLKYLIQQMLDNCPRSRPSADQCLAFPFVRKVWKKRERDYMFKSAMATVKSTLNKMWQFCLLILSMLVLPYTKLKNRLRKPSHYSSHSSSTVSNINDSRLDNSLSDDEIFDDINIHNNSIGAPLESSSSEGSFLEDLHSKPVRHAFTTPALRNRHFSHIPSPMSSSPNGPPSRTSSIHSASPIHHHIDDSFNSSVGDDDRPVTPTLNLMGRETEETTANKSTIGPKNLLGMFDAASDDEED